MNTATQSPGTQQRSTLIASMVLALALVAALPFGLAAWQIYQARESLVQQAQQTHLIAARASADRLASMFLALENAAEAAARNPQLYEDPASDAAREVLAGSLVGQHRLWVAATLYRDADRDVLVQRASTADAPAFELDALAALSASTRLFEHQGQLGMGVLRETGRPGLRIALLASAAGVAELLNPVELGDSARLLLLDGSRVVPLAGQAVETLPASLLQALEQRAIQAQAIRSRETGPISIGAFARLPRSDWAIVSLQPAEKAEVAAAEMRRAAWVAMALVLLLLLVLGMLAWRRVVQPVQSLLALHRNTLQGETSGSDLHQLQQAFEQIKTYQRNREALKEVFLGRYKILSTLGQGAMGSVFLAWDPRLKRHVAIKTIHIEAPDDRLQKALARTLENEAVAVANLHHPNIVAVYDLVASGQFAFVVMEYVEGGNLRQIVSRNGALTPAEVALIAQDMLKALGTAHQAGLLHLDIKPGNVLIPPKGDLRLTDFGVAAWRFEVADLVARGGLAGTPGFIAPEYVNGSAPTERSDLYSLGMLLVECLTGQAQHLPGARTGDMRRAAQRAVELPPRVLEAAPELCAAVLRLVALAPDARPANAQQALELFTGISSEGAAEVLAERAQELADERSGGDFDHAGAITETPGATTQPPPGGMPGASASRRGAATLPPPGTAAQDDDVTRPPPSGNFP